MSFLRHLFGFLKKKPEVQPEVQPEKSAGKETCAFCWGYQEYASETREMGYDKQIDVKNHRDKHVKVGKFMTEHVDGFKNKKRIMERCPKCGGKRIRFIENS